MQFQGRYVQIHWVIIAVTVIILTIGVMDWLDAKLKAKADIEDIKMLELKTNNAFISVNNSLERVKMDVVEIKTTLKNMERR